MKIIFTDICINIWKQIYVNIFFSSMANLKCTPSDRKMYPWGYMYPRLGTSGLESCSARNKIHLNNKQKPEITNKNTGIMTC